MSTTEKSNLEAVVEHFSRKRSSTLPWRRASPRGVGEDTGQFRYGSFGGSYSAFREGVSEYVLDSSVALKGILAEPHRTAALQLRDDFRSGIHRLIAPDIFTFEVGPRTLKAASTHKLTPKEAETPGGDSHDVPGPARVATLFPAL